MQEQQLSRSHRFGLLTVFFLITMAILGSSCLVPGNAFAAEQERLLDSGRFLGRGNTYVAAFDSDEATRGNPATLAETNLKFQMRWIDLDLFVGENTLDSISDVTKISGDDSAVSILNTFADKFGKRQYGKLQFSPLSVRVLSFELSPFVSSSNFVDLRQPSMPEVEFRSNTFIGANVALALNFAKTFSLGLNVKPMQRTLFAGDIAFSDLLDFLDDDKFKLEDAFTKQKGTYVAADLGGTWQPAPAWRFGLLVENVGYAAALGDDADAPPLLIQRINTGMLYRWDLKPWRWDFFTDIADIANTEGLSPWRLLHLGTEIGRSYISRDNDLGMLLGVNEGYFTAGGYIDFFLARLNLSYYAVELGEYPGQRKDRRWALTLLSSMTF